MTRVALVTGSRGGIGRALCAAFLKAGYRVVGVDQPSAVKGPDAAGETTVALDLIPFISDPDARSAGMKAILAAIGKDELHVLVNNAATQRLGGTADVNFADFSATIRVNVAAPLFLAQGLLQLLERAKGSVVNIGSVHANLTKPGFVVYATSKAALDGLTRAMAVDLGGRVRVNAIAPGAIATEMLEAGFKGEPEKRRQLASAHPAGRIGTPTDVAEAALWLASDASAFVTGATLTVDGAVSARLHDPA